MFALIRVVSTSCKETIHATSSIAELPRKFPRDFPGAALPCDQSNEVSVIKSKFLFARSIGATANKAAKTKRSTVYF